MTVPPACCATARSSPRRQEERFTRKKGDPDFPQRAVDYCLDAAGIGVEDLAAVGFYDKPLLKFERILETYLGVAPRGFQLVPDAGPLWIKDKLYIDRQLRDELGYQRRDPLFRASRVARRQRVLSIAFEEAAILTIDGVGEWATASIGVGRGNDIEILDELHWPDSLGLLYSAFTYYTGFKVNSGEYKVMGLAPYGEPKYVDLIYRGADRPPRGRIVPAESEVLQLPDRPDDDQRRVRQAVRRPAARAREQADAEGDGPRALGPGRLRGVMLRMARTAHKRHGARRTCAWRVALR